MGSRQRGRQGSFIGDGDGSGIFFLRWIKLRVFRRLRGSSSRKGKIGVNEKAKEELLV